ncbi:hypothetical protein ABIF68_005397 [Bradyrhizobium japonicum]
MSASSVPHAEMTTSACDPQGLEEADPAGADVAGLTPAWG